MLVHHSLYTLSSRDRKAELQEIQGLASPALAERFRTSNAVERHFYAHSALEKLLEKWSKRFPELVYIIYPVKSQERHNEVLIELLNQFSFGLSQLENLHNGTRSVTVQAQYGTPNQENNVHLRFYIRPVPFCNGATQRYTESKK